jgi:hypothetical protein
MKRLAVAAMLLLAVVGSGCPKADNAGTVEIVLTPADAPVVLEKVLEKLEVSAQVALDDVDGSGEPDYYVRYTGPERELTNELLGKVIATVTVALREVGKRSNFAADKAYLELLDQVYMAPMSELYRCETSPSPEAEAECLLEVWGPVTAGQYGRLDLPGREGKL